VYAGQTHYDRIEHAYLHIDKLVKLSDLLSLGFIFYCFPIKIKGASGGWIRAFTILEKYLHAIVKPLHFVNIFQFKVFI
jgi:hypothetical protein